MSSFSVSSIWHIETEGIERVRVDATDACLVEMTRRTMAGMMSTMLAGKMNKRLVETVKMMDRPGVCWEARESEWGTEKAGVVGESSLSRW